MSEIICTCPRSDVIDRQEVGHLPDCPMMTGVPAGTFRTTVTPGTVHFPELPGDSGYVMPKYSTELTAPEPILAGVLRARLDDGEIVILHTDDGGKVGGLIESVSDDGTVATVVEGRDQFEIDVTKIVVVQTLRRGKPPRGS